MLTTPNRPDSLTPTEIPPLPPEQPKNRRTAAIVVGLVLVGVVALAAAQQGTTSPTSGGGAPVLEAACVDPEAAMVSLDDSINEMNASQAAMNLFDIDGAASHLDAAAYDWEDVADYMAGDPSQATMADQVASDYHAAADALRAGDIDASTAHIVSATRTIGQATDDLANLDPNVPRC